MPSLANVFKVNVKVIEMSMSIYMACLIKVYCHAQFECHSLNIVRYITIKLQVKNVSHLRRSCHLA